MGGLQSSRVPSGEADFWVVLSFCAPERAWRGRFGSFRGALRLQWTPWQPRRKNFFRQKFLYRTCCPKRIFCLHAVHIFELQASSRAVLVLSPSSWSPLAWRTFAF